MKKRNKIVLIVSFLMVLVVILITNTSFLKITYYDEYDMFGPLSKSPLVTLVQFSLPILFMAVLWKYREVSPIILLIPFTLLVIIKYVSTELVDAFYVTSFYDAPGHFKRGLYVTVSGQSDPKIDHYFDIQPAFFWVTAMLLNICGAPRSLIDSLSILIIKWFPAFAVIMYVPILYLFYKQLLKKSFLVSTALLITFGVEMIHYHYAAQTYGRAVYWLLLTTMFYFMNRRDLRFLILTLLSGISLVFIHEGVLILTFLASIALVIYHALFRVLGITYNKFSHKEFLVLPIILGVSWTARLMYLTLYRFKDVISTFQKILETLIMENLQIIPLGIARAHAGWGQIVLCKAIYMFGLLVSGLILLFVNAYRGRDNTDKLAFCIMLLSTIFFGGAAIALGGAGYIERLPSLTLPILVYSILKCLYNRELYERRKVANLLVIVPLIMLIFASSIFYMSGRNFQSITYGEYHSSIFIIYNDPQNIASIYTRLKIIPIREIIKAELSNESITRATVISIQRYDVIMTNYYICSDTNFINMTIRGLHERMNIIYNNLNSRVLLSLRS